MKNGKKAQITPTPTQEKTLNLVSDNVNIFKAIIIPVALITDRTTGKVKGELQMQNPNNQPFIIMQEKFDSIPDFLNELQDKIIEEQNAQRK